MVVISSLSETSGVAGYVIEIDGASSSMLTAEFPYHGTSKPIEAAEEYLRTTVYK